MSNVYQLSLPLISNFIFLFETITTRLQDNNVNGGTVYYFTQTYYKEIPDGHCDKQLSNQKLTRHSAGSGTCTTSVRRHHRIFSQTRPAQRERLHDAAAFLLEDNEQVLELVAVAQVKARRRRRLGELLDDLLRQLREEQVRRGRPEVLPEDVLQHRAEHGVQIQASEIVREVFLFHCSDEIFGEAYLFDHLDAQAIDLASCLPYFGCCRDEYGQVERVHQLFIHQSLKTKKNGSMKKMCKILPKL